MTTEVEMKEALDGRFFTYVCESQTVTCRKVPKDHIPAHKPKIMDEDDKPKTGYPWSEAEDARLTNLRERDLTWTEIGKNMKMSATAVRNRYLVLCLKRGKKEHIIINRRPDTSVMERRVADLKTQDMTFSQIAAELGISRNQVAGLWARWRKRSDRWEEAA